MWRGLKCRVHAPLDCCLLSGGVGVGLSCFPPPHLMLKKKNHTQMEWLLLLVHIITSLQTKKKKKIPFFQGLSIKIGLFCSCRHLPFRKFMFCSSLDIKSFFFLLSSLFNLLAQQ